MSSSPFFLLITIFLFTRQWFARIRTRYGERNAKCRGYLKRKRKKNLIDRNLYSLKSYARYGSATRAVQWREEEVIARASPRLPPLMTDNEQSTIYDVTGVGRGTQLTTAFRSPRGRNTFRLYSSSGTITLTLLFRVSRVWVFSDDIPRFFPRSFFLSLSVSCDYRI